MSQFQPYGPENMSPIFISYNVFDSGSGRMVGSSGEHLKLDLCQDSGTFRSIPAIAFGQADYFEYIKNGKPFDVCYSVEMNEFRGNRNLQLNIVILKPDPELHPEFIFVTALMIIREFCSQSVFESDLTKLT